MRLRDINLLDSYHKWLNAAGVFGCYVRSGPFVSLKHYPDFEFDAADSVKDNVFEKIKSILCEQKIDDTIIIIDLDGVSSINQALLLNKHEKIAPVIVFNFLMHEFGLVGGSEFAGKLISAGNNLDNADPLTYAFILDYGRYMDFTDGEYLKSFNNQYELFDENLPTAQMLMNLNYKRVLYISEESVKEDIQNYLNYLKEERVEIITFFIGSEINHEK